MSGYGMAGHIGFAKETSGGVPIAASNYIEALSESFNLEIERFDTKNIVGRLSEPDDQAGLNRITGDLAFACDPENIGFFLLGAMTTPVNSEIAASGLYQHNFQMPTADWGTSDAQSPFTFEIYRDVTSSQQYAGCAMTSLEFNIAPNQDLRVGASVVGRSVSNIEKTTPTFVTSPVNVLAFDTASISIGGAASVCVEGMTLTLDNQLEGIACLNNTNVINKIKRTGFQMIRLAGSLSFEDTTEYNNFVDQTEQEFTLSFFRADSFSLVFTMPRVVYSSYPLGMGGRERQVVGFEAIARYHTGSASALTVDLFNMSTTY